MSESIEKLKALLELTDMSLENQRKILVELNDLLCDCIQDLFEYGIKFEDAGLFEKLLFQITYHNSSILKLVNGSIINVRKKEIQINDLTAISSIARLQIESFINLSYIFFIDCEYSVSLRTIVYKIQGLRKQIEITKKHPKDFPPIVKLRRELSIELLKLRKLNEFKELSLSKRRQLIYPKFARLIKLEEIYNLINIGDLSEIHSLYSNHIHSEYISIRQLVSSLKKPNEGVRNNINILVLCSRITSSTISNLAHKYNFEKGTLSKASNRIKKIIDSFNSISNDLSKR